MKVVKKKLKNLNNQILIQNKNYIINICWHILEKKVFLFIKIDNFRELDSDNSGDDKDKAIDRKRFKNKEHFTTQKK